MTSTTNRPVAVPVGARVRARTVAIVAGVVGGCALALLWSAEFVDREIGMSVANSVLGYDARETAIGGAVAGVAFAFVSGFAGTFTACNVAVFGALPAVAAGSRRSQRAARVTGTLRAVGWLSAGALAVAVVYGFAAVLAGPALPQLSTATVGDGVPARLVQSSVVFGVVGLAFCYLGLASLGVLRDPFASRPTARLLVLGALVGAFVVGRPYPLFFKLLTYAVATDNPLYGSLALGLQVLGNVLLMAAVALVLGLLAGRAGGRWLTDPGRVAIIGGAALLLVGTFLVVYWDVRLPALFGYGWFPTMPWNA